MAKITKISVNKRARTLTMLNYVTWTQQNMFSFFHNALKQVLHIGFIHRNMGRTGNHGNSGFFLEYIAYSLHPFFPPLCQKFNSEQKYLNKIIHYRMSQNNFRTGRPLEDESTQLSVNAYSCY